MIHAKRSLGQNFLHDGMYLSRIVHAAKLLPQTDCIVEIGPGTGLLTSRLLEHGLPVYAIEKDTRCVEFLQQKFNNTNFHIINADALTYDFSTIPGKHKMLIANLPYNISVPLILNYLSDRNAFEKYCVLVQKEVAGRLAGQVSTSDYGRLAVMSQTYCKITKHFDIPGNAFRPTTKVTSTFVTLQPYEDNNTVDFQALSELVALCFAYRRKMLRVVLKEYPNTLEAFISLGLPETIRAEQITKEQFLNVLKIIT